jgi:hypothetical protein
MNCILMGAYAISGKNKPGQRKWSSLPHGTWQRDYWVGGPQRLAASFVESPVDELGKVGNGHSGDAPPAQVRLGPLSFKLTTIAGYTSYTVS